MPISNDFTTITYSYISVEDYENSEMFLTAVCNNLTRVPGTMKLHAVHSIKPNSVWVRDTACFCQNCFNVSFQATTCCTGWKEYSVEKLSKNKSKNAEVKQSTSKKVNSEEAIEDMVEPNVNDFVAGVYDRKVYIGKVCEIDDMEAYIHFLSHNGNLSRNTKFKVPKVLDDVWLPFEDILCVMPEPVATKRALEICSEALDNAIKKFQVWQKRR